MFDKLTIPMDIIEIIKNRNTKVSTQKWILKKK